jgi:hypothetical protein
VDGEHHLRADHRQPAPALEQEAEWNFPDGDLSADQRHRARLWLTYNLPWGLSLGLTQALESGAPYSASNQNAPLFNGINPQPYVTNPGYRTPPDGGSTQYYYTARDAFRLEGQKRTDLAVTFKTGFRRRPPQLAGQLQVNIFNSSSCGMRRRVFVPAGNVANGNIDNTVRTSVTNPTYQSPLATTTCRA